MMPLSVLDPRAQVELEQALLGARRSCWDRIAWICTEVDGITSLHDITTRITKPTWGRFLMHSRDAEGRAIQ